MTKSSQMTIIFGMLLVAAISQISSVKLVKHHQPPPPPPAEVQQTAAVFQQEQEIQREQLQQQRQFEQLRLQQQQAELQIQQQQEEAQRQLSRPLYLTQRPAPDAGAKGAAAVAAPAPAPALAPPASAPLYPAPLSYESPRPYSPQYAPPQSTVAYLIVRPPYYDDSYQAYRAPGYLPPRPFEAYPKPENNAAYGTKGGRPEEFPAPYASLPPSPPPPARLEQADQAAIVVPVHADKQGKLKALIDKLMSKITLGSTYSVSHEEYVYPPPPPQPHSLSQPGRPQEAPIQQQQLGHVEQQQLEQIRESDEQALVQQQTPVEQEREPPQQQGFDEPAPKSPAKGAEQVRYAKDEQQQLTAQQFHEQPIVASKSQPLRQTNEAVYQQRQEEPKGQRGQPSQQQQYAQLPQDAKGAF